MFDYGNDRYAKACLSEAEKGRSPMRFGSVLVKGNSIIGRGRNRLANAQLREKMKYVDYCIHAEQDAILDAFKSLLPDAPVWGTVAQQTDGTTSFKFHVEHGNFVNAREALRKFVEIIQRRIDEQEKCPYYEPDGVDKS